MKAAIIGLVLFAISCLLGLASALFHQESLVIFSTISLKVLVIILMGGSALTMIFGLMKEFGR